MKLIQVNGERILAVIMLLFTGNLLASSIRYKFFIDETTPGAGLFPGIITSVLVFLITLWLISTLRAPKQIVEKEVQADSESSDLFEEMQVIDEDGKKRIKYVLAWSLALFVLFERVGVILGITLYVTGLLFSVSKIKIWKSLPIALALTILFSWGAIAIGVQLPDPFNLFRLLRIDS
jgi:hypothetical protein